MSSKNLIHFGPFEVTDQVFYKAPLCYALVNIKPVLPGHVLVIPYRQAQRLTDLSQDEVTDLFTTVQKVQKMLAGNYFAAGNAAGKVEDGSFNVTIQDGKWAGQTVAHVHCHIIPRTKGSDEGDGIYDRLESEEGNVGGGLWDQSRPTQHGKFPRIEDADRKPRSAEDMNRQAAFFREEMVLVDAKS
ncbi:Bis(5'-nucleosyl)-tetraphosphatase [asymmetrical] [Lachnellula willkommii]|uniref:Bis(5'-adenosyl)-triphosphatase n=1 Tax=Lachnellula willkommii TaxID=215461 RepID=A0A559M6L8_9HELO|nr:Bis(5'-nucleosyl)-tetraphosphatase [asymmetrical] [Lachnellula willkommii]